MAIVTNDASPRRARRRRRGNIILVAVRALAVLGVFAAVLGGIGLAASPGFAMPSARALVEQPVATWDGLYAAGDRLVRLALILVTAGVATAACAALLLTLAGVGRFAGRGSAAGIHATIQTALCLALLIGVNLFSAEHYRRWDGTGRAVVWDKWRPRFVASHRFEPQFTLPASVADDLRKLRGQTTVVVYQRHKTFGLLSDKPDAYDYAAERKVVEKVQDLVGLFREFGPQFRVVVLDVEDEDYDRKLKRLTENNAKLRRAIESAPENSIFFHTRREVAGADGKPQARESVQRLSFNDFYQLDKSASRKADHERGNLVLQPQGVESFARRVLAIEEKKPRIGIGVIHEYLSTEGFLHYTLAGLRKTLEAHGFEVVDVVLKKGWGDPDLSPAAYTLDETKLERLEEEFAELDLVVRQNRAELKTMGGVLDKLKSDISLEQLNQQLSEMLGGRKMSAAMRQANIVTLEPQIELLRDFVARQEKDRAEVLKQLETVPGQERLAEYRRMTDVKAKFERLLSDCDLLILPRLTLRNVIAGDAVPAQFYRLDESQAEAVKDFMRQGKPVFALFGPTAEPPGSRRPPVTGADNVEALLGQLGIAFGKQTVLFDKEQKAFTQRRISLFTTGGDVEIPPVYLDQPKVKRPTGELIAEVEDHGNLKPNPISQSLKVAAAATGSPDKLEKMELRHPRPVYYRSKQGEPAFTPEFLYSDPQSWGETEPFPTRDKSPRYDPPKPGEPPGEGDVPGPLPIAVAVETTVPADWYGSAPAQPTTVRVAAIGHGHLFSGEELSPAREQLLLSSCNWLLGRDDRLPRADLAPWSYPRVSLSDRWLKLWRYGAIIALPAAFAAWGVLVLLVRKYR